MSNLNEKRIPVEASLLPNLRLKILFTDGTTKYLSIVSETVPIAMTWMGSNLTILKDGSIKVNKQTIPLDYILANSTKEL
ncbi:hypothetical protein ACYSNW_03470 [Enterococcus sp. LJL99]